MHELSIASAIVESVLQFISEQPVGKIVEVRIAIGELTCLEQEQLRFCYEAITKETSIEASTLEIDVVDAEVRCSHCAYEGPPKYWDGALSGLPVATLECPDCGRAAEAIRGHECAIKSIKYATCAA